MFVYAYSLTEAQHAAAPAGARFEYFWSRSCGLWKIHNPFLIDTPFTT